MKTLKSLVLPTALILVAAGSAFATNVSKQSAMTTVQGHVYRPNEEITCQPTSKWCDNNGSFICTVDVGMGTEDLYVLQGTDCPNKLTNSLPE